MYDMGMDMISEAQILPEWPDKLVCTTCGHGYANGYPYTEELPDLGDVVICLDTEQYFGLVTNVGPWYLCDSCEQYAADFYPVYLKESAFA